MKVLRLDASNAYFQVSASGVEWWTACEQPNGTWYVVNMYGREIKPTGKRGAQIVAAAKKAQAERNNVSK